MLHLNLDKFNESLLKVAEAFMLTQEPLLKQLKSRTKNTVKIKCSAPLSYSNISEKTKFLKWQMR